jgi:prepilin-type N-terminal cleavage/methylation domain-containing protein
MRGMTLVEMIVVLAIIAVLVAVLTPVVTNYVAEARLARAHSDLRAIADAISRFERDLGRYPMFSASSALLQDSTANVVRLTGPGNLPTDPSNTPWVSNTTDADCAVACSGGLLEGQLLTNSPGYVTTSLLSKPFKWKGPYIDPESDPWGNAYLVNIINAKSTSADACFVLSAGPNGIVETAFNLPKTSSLAAAGDDLIYRIK